jgi:hypothetical protein
MNKDHITVYRPRDPLTQARHEREVLLQITLPIILAGVVLVGLAVGAALLPPARASLWADISLIWLIPGVMLSTLLSLVTFGAMAYGVIKLINVLPYAFYRIHKALHSVHHGVVKVSEKVTEPIMRVKMTQAKVKTFARNMRLSREENR